jgi:hypothetical protein
MKPKDHELIKILLRLNRIAATLPDAWDAVDKNKIRSSIVSLEREVSGHSSFSDKVEITNIFADKNIFPSRESIVAYLDSEFRIHLSPDWQRTRLEAEAARIASQKTLNEIQASAATLATQNWSASRPKENSAWQELFGKNEAQIRKELADTQKFPTIDELKKFSAGLLTYDQMKSISKRETLIGKIVAEITRHAGVSRLGE